MGAGELTAFRTDRMGMDASVKFMGAPASEELTVKSSDVERYVLDAWKRSFRSALR